MTHYKKITTREAIEKLRRLRKRGYNIVIKGKGNGWIKFASVPKKSKRR